MASITSRDSSKKRSVERAVLSVDDVRCPICNGNINSKWFHFRSENTSEFIAECWTREDPEKPRHIFRFQIEMPECVLVDEDYLKTKGE